MAKAPGALARRANLSAVLTLIHHGGSLTRSELTRRTGLNRSTIAALVAELEALSLARETAVDSGQVGRPSPLVSADPRTVAISANPDVDAVTVGLVGLGGVVHKRVRYPTAGVPSAAEATAIVAAVIEGWRPEIDRDYAVVGVGLAVPGLVHAGAGEVTDAPHLGWREVPLAGLVATATGLPARVANDATLGTMAERWFGAGRGRANFVYLNGSASGIGGGAVVGGELLLGAHGYAGEFGHTVVNPTGARCRCGRTGCLETEVDRADLLAALEVDDRAADSLDDLLAAAQTSPNVAAELDRQAGWLAVALANAVHVLNPEAVVLGGFLAALLRARPGLAEQVRGTGFGPITSSVVIEPALLGGDLLTVGAAELVFADLLADPTRIRPPGPPDRPSPR